MLKMLSNNIRFVSNNVQGIQAFQKRIKFFEYLKEAIVSSGFIFLQETHSTIHDEKNGTISLKESSSHAVKAILAESVLVS